jgi:hypothetical protein
MRITAKNHAAGTVKRTVPYKDFCISFISWGMATGIKLKDYILYKYEERIKEKKGSLVLDVQFLLKQVVALSILVLDVTFFL